LGKGDSTPMPADNVRVIASSSVEFSMVVQAPRRLCLPASHRRPHSPAGRHEVPDWISRTHYKIRTRTL
jgi:hypothetical protein